MQFKINEVKDMKEIYEKPVMDVNEYEHCDVLTISRNNGLNDNSNEGGGNGNFPF